MGKNDRRSAGLQGKGCVWGTTGEINNSGTSREIWTSSESDFAVEELGNCWDGRPVRATQQEIWGGSSAGKEGKRIPEDYREAESGDWLPKKL